MKQTGFPTRESTAMSRSAPLTQGATASALGITARTPPRERQRLRSAPHRRAVPSRIAPVSAASRRAAGSRGTGGRRPSGGYS